LAYRSLSSHMGSQCLRLPATQTTLVREGKVKVLPDLQAFGVMGKTRKRASLPNSACGLDLISLLQSYIDLCQSLPERRIRSQEFLSTPHTAHQKWRLPIRC